MIKRLGTLVLALLLFVVIVFPTAVFAGDGDDLPDDLVFVVTPGNQGNEQPSGVPVQGVSGATIDPVTGQFSWSPTEDQLGVWIIRFRVTDTGGLSDYEDVTITIYDYIDVNHDLAVNILDLILSSQHFGENVVPRPTVSDGNPNPAYMYEDVNNDGVINILDLVTISQGEWRDYNVRH